MGTINSNTDPDTVTVLHRRGPTQKTLRTTAVWFYVGKVVYYKWLRAELLRLRTKLPSQYFVTIIMLEEHYPPKTYIRKHNCTSIKT